MPTGERGHRKKRLIRPKQQIRFAVDLVLLALLLPVFMMTIPTIPPFSYLLVGIEADTLRALFWELIRVCLINWWIFLSAVLLLGIACLRVTHRIFGPLNRLEAILLQKRANPSALVSCKLRMGDYLHDYSELLEEVLNECRPGERREDTDRRSVVEGADSPTEDFPDSDSP